LTNVWLSKKSTCSGIQLYIHPCINQYKECL